RLSTKFDALEQIPWVEVVSQGVGGLGLFLLLGSFRKAARFIGANHVSERARSMMILLVVAIVGAMLLKGTMTGKASLGEGAFLLVPIVLVVAIFAIVYYLRVLRELRLAIVSWTDTAGDEESGPAPFASH